MSTNESNDIKSYNNVDAYLASLGTNPAEQHHAENFRSGFVALLGEPNAGKSTLVNKLLDFKVAIVSPKAQTTRDRIFGIYTDQTKQAVFIDTPGVMEPQDRLNECLRNSALQALEDADIVVHLFDAARRNLLPEAAATALAKVRKTVVLAINKCDISPELTALTTEPDPNARRQACQKLFPTIGNLDIYEEIFFVSAKEGFGTDSFLDGISAYLPEGPLLFDPDQPTDRPLRFLASEIVREKVLENFEEEIPYSVATQTEEFIERKNAKHFIRIVIFVEHESQKAILIGKDGAKLHLVGAQARPEIEKIADHPVYLELWVKVMKNWRKKDNALCEFGYQSRKPKKKNKKRRH